MPNIIITGASEGIGAELARQLARRHGLQAMLVLAARNANTLQSVSAECKALGARTLILPTDVTDPAQCQHLVDTTVRECGGLDILINNAGVSAHANFEDVPADKLAWYEQLMRVNLWGSIYCTHAAMPHLKQTQGRIVALSSLAGLVGIPGWRQGQAGQPDAVTVAVLHERFIVLRQASGRNTRIESSPVVECSVRSEIGRAHV